MGVLRLSHHNQSTLFRRPGMGRAGVVRGKMASSGIITVGPEDNVHNAESNAWKIEVGGKDAQRCFPMFLK